MQPSAVTLTDAFDATLQWQRDTLDRRRVMVHPDGGRTTYSYDAAGRPTSLVNPQLERTNWTYDAAGRTTGRRTADGTRTSFTYDEANQVTRVLQKDDGGTPFALFDYDYDATGRRVRVMELDDLAGWDALTVDGWESLSVDDWATLPVSGSVSAITTWTYDPSGQLHSEHRTGATSYRNTFTYDAAGNRTVLENLLDGRTTSTYDAANRLLTADALSGISTYTYDLAGNRRTVEEPSSDLVTNTWDAQNHLVQVELPTGDVVTYTWAPVNKKADERQVVRDDGVEVRRYVWDDQTLLVETDDFGVPLAETTALPGGFGQVISRRADAATAFHHFDALGNTAHVTDDTGAVTDDFRYEAFGKTASATGSTATPYQWIGEQGYRHDETTDSYNIRSRDYTPDTQAFPSPDPLGLASGDSNFYRYVANDPVNRTDPSGLAEAYMGNGGAVVGHYCPNNRMLVGRMVRGVMRWIPFDTLQEIQSGKHPINGRPWLTGFGTISWDDVFLDLGDPFSGACGGNEAASGGQTALPAPATCPATASQPEYLTVTIQPSCFESVLGEQPTTIRIWYERRGGADVDWDIQRLKLQAAARKIESIGGLKATKKSLSEGIVVGEVVVRSTFDAADTVDAVATFADEPTATNAGNVLLASLPLFFTLKPLAKAGDDLPGGGALNSGGKALPSIRSFAANAAEVAGVKAALNADPTNAGIGILDLTTGKIHLAPSATLNPIGHQTLLQKLGLQSCDIRGFVVAKNTNTGNFVVENISGQNLSKPGSEGMRMAVDLFDGVKRALSAAGL